MVGTVPPIPTCYSSCRYDTLLLPIRYLSYIYHSLIGSYLKSEEKLEPSRTLSLFKLLILVEPMISEVTSVTSPA